MSIFKFQNKKHTTTSFYGFLLNKVNTGYFKYCILPLQMQLVSLLSDAHFSPGSPLCLSKLTLPLT